MNETAKREKMPTQAQEYVLKIDEILSQIEERIKPILRVSSCVDKQPAEDKPPAEREATSQLLFALREIVEKAEYLKDRIDL